MQLGLQVTDASACSLWARECDIVVTQDDAQNGVAMMAAVQVASMLPIMLRTITARACIAYDGAAGGCGYGVG